MADLMTGTYSTENLRRDNGGFMIPDFSIEADGKQIRRSSKSGTLFIDSVQLKLSADASGFNISFTLSENFLAYEEYGDPEKWKEIARENHITNPLQVKPGQVLRLPAL